MNKKSLIRKIERIINRHSTDTGFSWDGDALACYLEPIRAHLTSLVDFSLNKNKLNSNQLSDVVKDGKQIADIINNIRSDKEVEKYAKIYSSLFEKVLKTKNELFDQIKENNSITSSFEVAIAQKHLEKMKSIESQEENNFKYLEHAAKSGKAGYLAYHIENDDYMLLSDMKSVNSLNNEISKLSTTEEYTQQLTEIQEQARNLNEKISNRVINHYDELNKIDEKLNKENPLIRSINAEKLREEYENEL